MLYNINRDRKADPRGKAWGDWFPQEDQRREPQTDDQMFAAMKMLALMQRARLARQRD